jgi:hypothetical protein
MLCSKWLGLLGLAACIAACSGEAGRKGGNGGDAGAAGSGGAPDMPDGPNLLEQLKACEVEEPCKASSVQLVEGSQKIVAEEETRCLLEALRDRRPGRYLHSSNSTDSATSQGADHVIVVSDDGDVLHAARSYSSKYDGSSGESIRGERCHLKDAAYFEACLEGADAGSVDGAGGAGSDETWDCLFGSGWPDTRGLVWLEGCETAETLACE